MARKIRANLPDGRKINLTVPDGATNEQIKAKLQSIPSAPTPPSPKRVEGLPGLFQQLTEPSETTKLVERTTGGISPISAGGRARDIVQNIFNVGGGEIAEGLAGPGITAKPTNLPSPLNVFPALAQPGEPALKTSPETSAAIGTGIQMVPDIAETVLGGGLTNLGRKAALKTLTTKGIGAKIGQLEKAAGLEQLAGSRARVATELGLEKTAEIGDIINAVNKIKDIGEQLAPQLAKDLSVFLKEALPKLGKQTTTQALGRQAEKFALSELNRQVAGRASLVPRFEKAARRKELLQNVLSGTGKALKRGAGLAALGGGATVAAKLLGLGK